MFVFSNLILNALLQEKHQNIAALRAKMINFAHDHHFVSLLIINQTTLTT